VPELAVFEQMHEFIFIEEKFLKILSQHRCAEVFSGVKSSATISAPPLTCRFLIVSISSAVRGPGSEPLRLAVSRADQVSERPQRFAVQIFELTSC
jgi:hypothetical protein